LHNQSGFANVQIVKIPDEARAWLRAIGRKGGLVKSKAKTVAVRKNGKLGGRPQKDKK
jgi:hypothetical protein